MTTITIIVATASSSGQFTAKLASDGDVLVTSSRTPFLDAARRLLEIGFSPKTLAVMRHAGSQVDSLRATIGDAAALTVTSAGNGRPVFAVRVAAALPIRSHEEAATPLAPKANVSTGEAAATDSPPIAPYASPKVTEPPNDQRTDEVEDTSLAEARTALTQTPKKG
jgi:hypothetical protein